jgi:hypothetical protein
VSRTATLVAVLACGGATALTVAAPAASAKVRRYWVAAVPAPT